MLDLRQPLTYPKSEMNLQKIKIIVIIASHIIFSQGYLVATSSNMSNIDHFPLNSEQKNLPFGGSTTELQQISELNIRAKEAGFVTKQIPIVSDGEFHSFSSILSIHIKGRYVHTLRLIIPISMPKAVAETDYDAKINFELIKILINKFRAQTPLHSIELVILGDDSSFQPKNSAMIYLKNTQIEKTEQILYFSFSKLRSAYNIIYTSKHEQSPLSYLQNIFDISQQHGFDMHINTADTFKALFGLGIDVRLSAFLEAGLNAISLTEAENSKEISLEHALEQHAKFVELWSNNNYSESQTSDIAEKNYVPLSFLNQLIIIKEFDWVLILIIFISLQMLFLYILSEKRHYFIAFFKDISASLFYSILYFSIAFLCFGLLLPLIEAISFKSIIWVSSLIFLGLIVSLFLLEKFKVFLPRNSKFFSVNTLIIANLSVLILAIINITLIGLVIIPAFFIILVVLLKNRVLKLLFLIISLLIGMTLLLIILSPNETDLLSSFGSNYVISMSLLACLMVLPQLLQIYRISRIFPIHRARYPFLIKFLLILFTCFLASIAAILIGQAQIVQHKMSAVKVNTDFLNNDDVVIQYIDSNFLGRKRRIITISANRQLATLNLTISATSQNNQILFCNFPIKYIEDGEYNVLLGHYPPQKIEIELVVEEDFVGNAKFQFFPTDSYGQAGMPLEKNIDW